MSEATDEPETGTAAEGEPPKANDDLVGLLAGSSPAADLSARQSFSALQERLFGQRPPEAKLGPYVLGGRLAAGGGGVVYTARDPKRDLTVAVKLLLPGAELQTANARARLLREGQSLAKLAHENIVRVIDIGTYDPSTLWLDGTAAGSKGDGLGVFIVMEYVQGQNLARWLAETRPSWREVTKTFVSAGRGLAAAHAAGLVHRDFKPANVLVGNDGRICVADFGLARATRPVNTGPVSHVGRLVTESAKGLGAVPLDSSLTATGAFVGTPAYMPPEQQTGGATTERSDQYSFCVALWEGWFGTSPFAGATASAILKAKLGPRFLDPPRDHEVPEALVAVIRQGMAPDPEDRLPSMNVLLDRLTVRPSSTLRRTLIGVGIAAASLAAGAAYFGWGTDEACQQLRTDMAVVWAPAVRARVADRGPLDAKVNLRVDAWVERWSEVLNEQCAASSANANEPRAPLLCLEEQRRLFAGVIALEPRVEAAGWANAEAELPEPGACTVPPFPTDAPSLPLRALSLELEALRMTQRMADAKGVAVAVRRRVDERRGTPRAIARARVSLATLRRDTGEFGLAWAHLTALGSDVAPEIKARADLLRLDVASRSTFDIDPNALRDRSSTPWPPQSVPLFAARQNLVLARYFSSVGQPTKATGSIRAAQASLEALGRPHALGIALLVARHQAEKALELRTEAAQTADAARELATRLYGEGHPLLQSLAKQLGEP